MLIRVTFKDRFMGLSKGKAEAGSIAPGYFSGASSNVAVSVNSV
jgi:hypothetical protein